jgi:hypothetical protein
MTFVKFIFLSIILIVGVISLLWSKWLLKNAPGSVGSIAKTIAKDYNLVRQKSGSTDWKILFLAVFSNRRSVVERLGLHKGCLYSRVPLFDFKNGSEGHLRVLVFQMMFLEAHKFREATDIIGNKGLKQILDVMHEVISKEAPEAITKSKEDFINKIFLWTSLSDYMNDIKI